MEGFLDSAIACPYIGKYHFKNRISNDFSDGVDERTRNLFQETN